MKKPMWMMMAAVLACSPSLVMSQGEENTFLSSEDNATGWLGQDFTDFGLDETTSSSLSLRNNSSYYGRGWSPFSLGNESVLGFDYSFDIDPMLEFRRSSFSMGFEQPRGPSVGGFCQVWSPIMGGGSVRDLKNLFSSNKAGSLSAAMQGIGAYCKWSRMFGEDETPPEDLTLRLQTFGSTFGMDDAEKKLNKQLLYDLRVYSGLVQGPALRSKEELTNILLEREAAGLSVPVPTAEEWNLARENALNWKYSRRLGGTYAAELADWNYQSTPDAANHAQNSMQLGCDVWSLTMGGGSVRSWVNLLRGTPTPTSLAINGIGAGCKVVSYIPEGTAGQITRMPLDEFMTGQRTPFRLYGDLQLRDLTVITAGVLPSAEPVFIWDGVNPIPPFAGEAIYWRDALSRPKTAPRVKSGDTWIKGGFYEGWAPTTLPSFMEEDTPPW